MRQLFISMKKLIVELPKDCLICRKKDYYNLKYRENGKLYDEYIGRNHVEVERLQERLVLWKLDVQMLFALKQEQKTIKRIKEVR